MGDSRGRFIFKWRSCGSCRTSCSTTAAAHPFQGPMCKSPTRTCCLPVHQEASSNTIQVGGFAPLTSLASWPKTSSVHQHHDVAPGTVKEKLVQRYHGSINSRGGTCSQTSLQPLLFTYTPFVHLHPHDALQSCFATTTQQMD